MCFCNIFLRHSHPAYNGGHSNTKEGLVTEFVQGKHIGVFLQHLKNLRLSKVHYLPGSGTLILHSIEHPRGVNVDAANTVFLQIVPMLVYPPGRTRTLCNLMAIPADEINASLDLVLVPGKFLGQSQNRAVSGGVTGNAGFPGVNVSIDQQVLLWLFRAPQISNRERKRIPTPGRLGTYVDHNFLSRLA